MDLKRSAGTKNHSAEENAAMSEHRRIICRTGKVVKLSMRSAFTRPQEDPKKAADGVTLIILHAAKGLNLPTYSSSVWKRDYLARTLQGGR